MNDDFLNRLREPLPVPAGTRIRLLDMPEDLNPIKFGATGTVTGGNGAQMWVDWDDGRNLAVLVGLDKYEVIKDD